MNVQRVAPLSGDSGIYVVVDIDDIWNIRVVVLSQLIAAVRCPSALRVDSRIRYFPYFAVVTSRRSPRGTSPPWCVSAPQLRSNSKKIHSRRAPSSRQSCIADHFTVHHPIATLINKTLITTASAAACRCLASAR